MTSWVVAQSALLLGCRELGDGEDGRPHGAVVEGRLLEAELRVAGLELRRRLEVAHDLAVARVGGHAVPGLGGEPRRRLGDELVHLGGQRPVLLGISAIASRQAWASAAALSLARLLVRTSDARACIAARSSAENLLVLFFFVLVVMPG